MAMVFFSNTNTPLYSMMWTPSSTGQYAGTCIFLIILAVIFRGLFGVKHYLESLWLGRAIQRRYVVVADKQPESERIQQDPNTSTAVLTSNGVDENVKVVKTIDSAITPWRFSVDLPRAALVTVHAGVGWLLMLAVMTMNVGYFISVLAGTFLGELAVGRFSSGAHDHAH